MNQDYKQIVESVKLYATFSDIHGYKVPKEEIIKKIEGIDKSKALIILSRFSMLDEEVLEIIKSQLMKKRGIESGSLEYEKYVSFGPDNLLYTIKWFLAYGRINLGETLKISQANLNDVLDVILKVSDYMIREIDGDDSLRELAFKATLTLKGKSLRRSLYRQNIMFGQIAKDASLFNQKEYIDIHTKFEEVNGFSIKDYVATLFTLAINSELKISKEQLATSSVEKDPVQYFNKTNFTPQALKVCRSLTVNPNSLKDWALETIENPFDYEAILSTPFFSINQKLVVSSPVVIESSLFDGLFFRIKNCLDAKKFFSFYGRVFEQYVSKTLASAVSNSDKAYEVIPEFKYGKEKKDSSDVYLKLGKSLMIFECKSGRINRNTKIYAEERASEEDFKKYVINPLRQAYRTYEQIIEDDKYAFGEINKIYIFSISSQAFPKVASKKLNITKEMIAGDNSKVKGIDYIGLDDFETLAYAIENYNDTIFTLINKKINHRYYLKYDSYLYNEGHELNDIKWHKEALNKTMEDIKSLM